MRKRTGLVIAVAVTLTVSALTPWAEARKIVGDGGDTTLIGTNRDDKILGSAIGEAIFGRKGDDKLIGGDNADNLLPGKGIDRVFGGLGNDLLVDDDGIRGDKLFGQEGDDWIYAADGSPGRVDCGPGTDTAFVDIEDALVACETVRTVDGSGFAFGTNGSDNLLASVAATDEIVSLKKANDSYVGDDDWQTLLLGKGTDLVVPANGDDVAYDDDGVAGDDIQMGPGGDLVWSIDGARDSIDCGDNSDVVYADPFDVTTNCEFVYIS